MVIPSYNSACYLSAAVDSALAQTMAPWEIIVVDDGSTDGTRALMHRYACYPSVHYIYQANRGLSGARNTGIQHATGDFLAFLDADDRWKPTKLEAQMALFTDERVGLVFCGAEWFDETGVVAVHPADPRKCQRILQHLAVSSQFAPSSTVVRRACFTTCGLFDEALRKVEDREMWIRIAASYEMRCIADCLLEYRNTPGGLGKRPEGMEEAFRLTYHRVFRDGPLRGRYRLACQARAYMHLDWSWVYHDLAQHGRAWLNVVQSLLWYPLPDWEGAIFKQRFARWRRLLRYTITPNHDRKQSS